MEILYIYSNCSVPKYKELFLNSKEMVLQQAQKYHSLLIDGLHKNKINVTCISGLPINRKVTKKFIIKQQIEIVNGVKYIYYSTINFPVLRQLCIIANGFINAFKIGRNNKHLILVCDVLNVSNCIGALSAARILRKKCIGIVTDVPGVMVGDEDKDLCLSYLINKIKSKINRLLLNKFDAYVFLTKQMNSLINVNGSPFVVLEGHADINMRNYRNDIEEKYRKQVVLYSGSLKKVYGIKKLVEAFIRCDLPDTELHIYGDGDYTKELTEICKTHNNVIYKGVKPNDYIVSEQIKATLLVNPRPTSDEYTKYSFPSKNLEYMASGTPVLTTKLDGMPGEYDKYVYLIEDESIDGIRKTLENILNKSQDELHLKGQEAKEFVLNNKNNIVQTQKIIELIRKA